jgi:hypothetical protein
MKEWICAAKVESQRKAAVNFQGSSRIVQDFILFEKHKTLKIKIFVQHFSLQKNN